MASCLSRIDKKSNKIFFASLSSLWLELDRVQGLFYVAGKLSIDNPAYG
jgi:hypothetical protein